MIERMLDHLYSPQMSDIFVRLLNFNRTIFKRRDDEEKPPDSSTENSTLATDRDEAKMSEVAA